MKTEISRDSHQPDKRYSGVYQQQGRMLTDADWNELVEILKQRLNDALKDVVGRKEGSIGGVPRHRALKINDDLTIQPGHLYVDGIAARIHGDTPLNYDVQSDFPGAPDLPSAPDNNFTFYADVWERTVTHLMDEYLRDKGLHGADTCTRKQMMAQVKWWLIDDDPEQSARNPAKGDAKLSLTLHKVSTQPDPCDPCAAELDVVSKVGNYLFRVEVHDVKGDANNPSEITLKWSNENGAEQFPALPTKEEMPAGFINDGWVYEFFDQTSEKHLGVHLVNTSWEPVRGELTEIKEPSNPYEVPTIPGSSEEIFVRRWDGYCRLDLSGTGSVSGVDRGIVLSTSKDEDKLGYANIGDSLHLVLDSIKLDMEIKNKSFVAGDYWLAEVREAEHKPLVAEKSKLIENELPHGIEHHYLTLGKVEGDILLPNPEADRKYAFPPLTEMTRMFHVGGDGQEAMPNHLVPQSLKVGVTNGEWPVAGARVEFRVVKGKGLLKEHSDFLLEDFDAVNQSGVTKTDKNGIAKCGWELGSAGSTADEKLEQRKQRIAVRLLNPNHDPGDSESEKYLDHPPVHFYANLSTADQVAYVNPVCTDDSPSVNSLLQKDSNENGLFPWPDLDNDSDVTVKDVLDALLCKIRAKHIPYDPTNATRWNDINLEEEPAATPPETVQDAIDDLLENLHSEDIKYPLPDCSPETNTFKSYIVSDIENIVTEGTKDYARIVDLWNAVLCHLNAAKLPYNPNETSTTTARWKDIMEQSGTGDLSEPNTVQEAIDELIKWLESTDIRYEVLNCGTDESPSVRSLLQISPGQSKVDDILDQLLCYFNATDLPLDKTSSRLCDELKFEENVKSVQDAIEFLCAMKQVSCAVNVSRDDSLEDIISRFIESENKTIHLRLLPGIHAVKKLSVIDEHKKNLIALTGCGAEFTTLEFVNELRFYAKHVILKNIKIITVDTGSIFLKAQDIDIDNCEFLRYGGEESAQAFISVEEIASEIGDGMQMRISSTLNWKQSDVSVYVSKSTYLPGSDKSIITAISDVPASATSTWNKLADFFSASYKADNMDYVKSTREIAREILEIPIADRKTIYNARPLDNINGLPGRSFALRSLGSFTSDISASTAASITSLDFQLNNKKTQRTEKELVESYYSVLNSAEYTEAHVATLADLLSNLAEAVYSAPGTALALSSTAINGTISDSSIWGKLALFSNHQNEIQLKESGSINSIEKGLAYLNGSGSLKLEANYLREVVSNIRPDSWDESNRKVVEATSAYYQLQLIDNTIVSGASFFANNIIMTGNKLVDRTPSSQETGVAALVLCYDGVFNANSAVNPEAKIQRISRSKVQSANHINFLDLYDPDGTHVQVLGNGEETPAGTIMAYSSDRIPDNWLECNGYQIDRVRYAALFAAIGTQFGPGNGSTTFNIPDLRGEFIRGLDHGRNVDPDTGRVIGSWQEDQIQDHDHNTIDSTVDNPVNVISWFAEATAFSSVLVQAKLSGNAIARTGTETRPRNVALMYCMKY